MRGIISWVIGLSTVMLFLSIYSIPFVNGQSSNPNNEPSNEKSVQTENSDPFKERASDNNINSGSTTNPSPANDGSTGSTDKDSSTSSTDKDSSTSSTDSSTSSTDRASSTSNNHDDNKGSDDSKSSEDHKDSESKDDGKSIPFP